MLGLAHPIFVYPKSGRKDFAPLGHLDGRTKAARILKSTRDALIEHCGASPSITQLAIIDRCCWLTLKLSMLDGKIVAGKDTGFDSDQYLAWSNSLRRAMRDLGFEPAEEKTPSLAEQLKAERAA